MISFRYHVVTIVAVFLALAVGLLGGGAFVQPALQRQLESQTSDLREANADLRRQIDEVRAELGAVDAFAEAALPLLAEDRLLGRTVVIVTQEGVDDAVLGQTQRSLAEAGADVVAVLSARADLASDDPETQGRLAELLVEPGTAPVDLPRLAAEALADRLADGAPLDPDDDVLESLLSEGFLAPVGGGLSEETLQRVGIPGQVVVVLGGSIDPDPALPPEAFGAPLTVALAERDVDVAAGEATFADASIVEAVLDGTGEVVTVDDLDLSMGGAALVLGLERLVLTGEAGAYGLGEGADPLPPPS